MVLSRDGFAGLGTSAIGGFTCGNRRSSACRKMALVRSSKVQLACARAAPLVLTIRDRKIEVKDRSVQGIPGRIHQNTLFWCRFEARSEEKDCSSFIHDPTLSLFSNYFTRFVLRKW